MTFSLPLLKSINDCISSIRDFRPLFRVYKCAYTRRQLYVNGIALQLVRNLTATIPATVLPKSFINKLP